MEGLRRNFEAKYAAVGNNDPAVTEVDCTGRILFEFFGNGDAHLLGVSLQRNSHVKSIILALSTLEVEVGREGAVDSLSPLLNYLRQSQSMRKIELRGTTTIFSRPLSVTVLRRFLLAIAENSMIEELILFVINVRPEGFAELMRTTQSIYKLTITFCTFGMRISSLELVAHAIGTNRSIEILTIKNVDVDLASPVLLRLGAHPWIRMVEICGGYRFNRERDLDREPFIRALQSFIPSSRMLEHFTIGDYILTEDVMTAFATGIGSSKLVSSLEFNSCRFGRDCAPRHAG